MAGPDLPSFHGIIGRSAAMQALFRRIERVAPLDVPVLIQGETGTGKELVARAIQRLSARAERPFEIVNCGALTRELLLSELFGHERGAFTGAVVRKHGLLAVADGGTVFLDEVGDLPLDAQVMLLRFLQSGEIRPVGSTETRRVDVRLIAATHRDLDAAVESGTFREDLYYRLRRVVLEVPPLRARGEDLPAAGRALPRAAQRAPRAVGAGRHAAGAPVAGAASVARQRAGAGGGPGAGDDLQAWRVDHAGGPRSAGAATRGGPGQPRPVPGARAWRRRRRCSAGSSTRCSGSRPSVAKSGAATSSRSAASPAKSRGARSRVSCELRLLRRVGLGRAARYVPLSFWLTLMSDVAEWVAALV